MEPVQRGAPQAPREPFWRSMAGMMTAGAALITALVGVAAFIYQVSGSNTGQPATTGPAPASVPPAAATGPAIAPSTDTASAPIATDDAGSGPFTVLFNNNGVDLDADPPSVAGGSDPSIDIYDGAGSIQSYPIWSGLAKWTQPGNPGRADCLTLLNGFATVSAAYIKGSQFCVRTRDNRHVALVEFVEPTDGGWKIRVTVWPGAAA
ncbi:hypothetical protein GCM10023322_42450 [Rugosimonospora acidiphila]|uniref:Uncharacterized protein n=1 Tax=Rugosimonospora acidiphila TaxID=556531 RepID=A0ABP9S106_9ACTN